MSNIECQVRRNRGNFGDFVNILSQKKSFYLFRVLWFEHMLEMPCF